MALNRCLSKFRCFFWGCHIILITDHQALCSLMSKQDNKGLSNNCHYRSSSTLLADEQTGPVGTACEVELIIAKEYDITVVYRGKKVHNNADFYLPVFASRRGSKQIKPMHNHRNNNTRQSPRREESRHLVHTKKRSTNYPRHPREGTKIKGLTFEDDLLYRTMVGNGKDYRRLCLLL